MATRKPSVVISPENIAVDWNASGIMVSLIIARIAPAAIALTNASVDGAAPSSSA